MHVGRDQDLGYPFGRLVADHRESRQVRCGPAELVCPHASTVGHVGDVVAVTVASGGTHEEVERLGMAQVAGVHDHGPVAEAVFGPVGGVAVRGPDGVGVDEVGDNTHLWTCDCRCVLEQPGGFQLGSHVGGQVI